jgi:glutamate---cysteine ligase / carboxylate-amine ligase
VKRLGLWQGYGVEIETMLVDRESLAVRPEADRILDLLGEEEHPEPERGIEWSNELVLHVVESKTAGPAPALEGLAERFQAAVREAGALAAELTPPARLMPTGMHPWFDPDSPDGGTRLWPHDGSEIYRAYDRIFGTRGHGWSNLQATHLNLPFDGDEEFGRLHAGIRLLLPILPALAASTPIVEGRVSGLMDSRLEAYRTNSRRFTSITGRVVPEPVFDRAAYEAEILAPIYRDLAPLDPEGILRDEFSNARGAIARFGRGSIEIRVLDTQEAPRMDLAVVAAAVGALKLLAGDTWAGQAAQRAADTGKLADLLLRTIRDADRAAVDEREYLACFGLAEPVTAGGLWRHLVDRSVAEGTLDAEAFGADLEVILHEGPLARRILRALGSDGAPDTDVPHPTLHGVYRDLCDHLDAGEPFRGGLVKR